jgi:hypothetical protein
MTPKVTKTVLNKIILNVWTLDRKWTSIIIWPRDRASISVQQLCIMKYSVPYAQGLFALIFNSIAGTANNVKSRKKL